MNDKCLEGEPAARVPREVQWRRRAARLVSLAREAQFELTAKTIRYAALVAVMTPAECADFNARIKRDHADRIARLHPGNTDASPLPKEREIPPHSPEET